MLVVQYIINRGGKYSVRNLRYGPRTRLVRGIYSLCPPSFFLSLSLFSFPTTESLEQAILIMTHKTHASLYFFWNWPVFWLVCSFFAFWLFWPVHSQSVYCFSMTSMAHTQFQDFPSLENEIIKFHDILGFPLPVRTLKLFYLTIEHPYSRWRFQPAVW